MAGMTEHAVVIVGGGPTGTMLAAELRLAGADVVVVERRTDRSVLGSRAGGLHARTLEVLDQRGVVDRFLDEGQVMQTGGFAYVPLDISDFPTRHNHGLALQQIHIERILGGWADELGVPVLGGRDVVGLRADDDGVDVELSDGSTLRAQYVVGCDGGRSVVRKAAGIGFPGVDASMSFVIAEAEMAETPEVGVRREGGGIGPVEPGGSLYRIVIREQSTDHPGEASFDDVKAALVAACGTDWGVHSPRWISRFSDAARQADRYRAGRVLLAGDAAHIHSPMGGQGLNFGVQDAVNLGWKLAQVVDGTSPPSLLDSYHDERHPVGARVLANTMAQGALVTPDERHDELRRTVAELLALDEPRRRIAGMMTGLDVHYDLGDGHPLLGRRMPDLDLVTADGPTRVYELLHAARPVLLDLGGAGDLDLAPWSDRVERTVAETAGPWELPVLGPVEPAAAVLVRPDGHVAWVATNGADCADDLPGALTRWFGAPLPVP